MKKLLAFFLAIIMIFASVPASVFAQGTEENFETGYNDTGYYYVNVYDNGEYAYWAYNKGNKELGYPSSTLCKTTAGTAYAAGNSGHLHIRNIEGETFVEWDWNEAGARQASTSFNVHAWRGLSHKTDHGVSSAIPTENLSHIAMRVRISGGVDGTASVFSIRPNSPLYLESDLSNAYLIDYDTREVVDPKWTGQGFEFTSDFNGWIVVPFSAWGTTKKFLSGTENEYSLSVKDIFLGTKEPIAEEVNSVSTLQFWLHGSTTTCSHGEKSDWTDRVLYMGDLLFVEDTETFNSVRLSCDLMGHEYEKISTVEPDCTTEGYSIYKCKHCSDSYNADFTDIAEHTYEIVSDIKGSCTEKGERIEICTQCGFDKITETDPTGHDYDKKVILPTETEQGYTEYTCKVCSHSYKDDFTDFGHVYNRVLNVVVTPSDVDITVSWDAFDGADRYLVRALNPDGTTFNTQTISDGSLSAVFKGFEFDKEYTFYVIARVDGKYQRVEDADKVKASLVIGNRVVGIKSSVKGRVITVSWKAFPEADRYYVFVYPKGADPTINANRVTTVNAENETTVGIINAISPETDYDIYVSARVGGKYQSLDNALYTSAVIPVTPPTDYEIIGSTPTAVRIKWTAVKNADKYWVRLVDSEGNTLLTKESDKAVVNLTNLTPETEYYVQLQARVPKSSGGNVYSGYCDPFAVTFTTPELETVSVSAYSIEGGAQISWNAHTNASEYMVYRIANGKNKLVAKISDPTVTTYADKVADGIYTYGVITKITDGSVSCKTDMKKSAPVAVGEETGELFTYTPVDTTGMTDLQKAIVLTAESYHIRGSRIQYEDTRLISSKSRDQWRWGYIKQNSPETYTSQDVWYSNCAAFTHEAYWNAFDLDIKQFQTASLVALEPSADSRVVFKKMKSSGAFDTAEKRATLEKEFKEILEPGDLMVYIRDSGTGHVMMYVGNGMMIDCSGKSYNWDEKHEQFETKGAIRYQSYDMLFDEASSVYLFEKKGVSIVRPLKTYTGSIPQKTLDRMGVMRGVVAEKTASVNKNVTVNVGDEITYTITLTNYSTENKTLNVSDIVPANTTYVSGGNSKNGDTLSWVITLPAHRAVSVSYTVRVNDDAEGKTILGDSGKVESIDLKCHDLLVKNTLTKEEQEKIVAAAELNSTSDKRDIALADAIYKTAFGESVLSNATASDILNGVFKNFAGTSAWPSRWQTLETTKNTYLSMLVPHLYGGRQVINESVNSVEGLERTRLVTAANLVVGDVIVTNNPATETYTNTQYTYSPVSYMFLGDKILDLTNNKMIDTEPFLEQLLCQRHFCIVRPSIVM